jgi:hypothetical protein
MPGLHDGIDPIPPNHELGRVDSTRPRHRPQLGHGENEHGEPMHRLSDASIEKPRDAVH